MPLQAHCRPIAGPLQELLFPLQAHCRSPLQAPWRAERGPIAGPLQAHCKPIAMYKQTPIASFHCGSLSGPIAGPIAGLMAGPLRLLIATWVMEYDIYHHQNLPGQSHTLPQTEYRVTFLTRGFSHLIVKDACLTCISNKNKLFSKILV